MKLQRTKRGRLLIGVAFALVMMAMPVALAAQEKLSSLQIVMSPRIPKTLRK